MEVVDLRGENAVDAEWIAYLGAFRCLSSLNLADCHRINSSALWALTGINYIYPYTSIKLSIGANLHLQLNCRRCREILAYIYTFRFRWV